MRFPDSFGLSSNQRRAVKHGLVIAGLITAVWMYGIEGDPTWREPAKDGLVYWVVDPSDHYGTVTTGAPDAYPCSLAFA